MKDCFLETERLILRFMDDSDFVELMSMLGDPEVMYAWEHDFTEEDGRAWLERRKRGYLENGFDYFLAIEKTSGAVVGQIGLLKELLGDETLYGIGWILKRSAWGEGYATEGARGIMDYAFRLLGIPELVADIRPENTASCDVAKRIGMVKTNTVVKIVNGKDMPHDIYRIKNPYEVHCVFRCPQSDAYPASAIEELQTMVTEDISVREKLQNSGELQKLGYHPEMETVHVKNSLRLEEMIAEYGFPTMDIAGKVATDNAWLIIQHAISRPVFMRAALALFGTLSGYQLPPAAFAYLADRIAFYGRRPQSYGTQFDYNLDGEFDAWWIEKESSVDLRRGAVGLPPLNEVKEQFLRSGTPKTIPVTDAFKMRVMQERWLVHVGWCTTDDIARTHNNYPL